MSSAKQKILENERWPHVKRNWIKAIKAIRVIPASGGVVELPETQARGTLSTGNGCKLRLNSYQKDIWRAIPQKRMELDVEGNSLGFLTAHLLTA